VNALARYLVAYGLYGVTVGTLYYLLTEEWVGSILLWLIGVAPLIVVAYAVRRHTFRQTALQDDPNADPAVAAGEEVGEFPTSSAWPVFLVLGVVVTGAALVYGLLLLPLGIAVLGVAVIGLVRESG
jgi:hypothetical protein